MVEKENLLDECLRIKKQNLEKNFPYQKDNFAKFIEKYSNK